MGRLKLKKKPGGITGPLPDEVIRCEIEIEKRPTDDWMHINKAALDRGDIVEPDDDDMVVGLNAYGYLAIPKDNLPPNLWPQGRTLLLTLQEVSYVDFRAECLADIERKRAPETPEEHRAELGEIGDAALAAARKQRDALAGGLGAVAIDTDGAIAVAVPRPKSWWRRLRESLGHDLYT